MQYYHGLDTILFAIQVSMIIDNGTIGVCIKDVYVPQSNSVFEFVAEVVCETYPQSSGCIVKEK